jgi:O-antigen/teichoic acid export membrane protein
VTDRATGTRVSYTEGAAFGVLSFGAMTALGLLSSVVIARLYGVQVIGQFALVLAPMNLVTYLSSVRERAAFVREVATLEPRAPRITGLFAAMLTFSVGLTALVGTAGMVIAYLLFVGPIGHAELFVPALANMASYVLIVNTGWNLDGVLTGFRAGRQLFWIRLHQALAFAGVAVAAGIAWGTVWGLVLATTAASLTSFAHRVVAVRAFMRGIVPRAEIRDGFRSLPEMVRFGLKIAPGSVANGLSNEAATWVLGAFGSLSAVGSYNRAWTLARRFIEGNWMITEMLLPTLVERRTHGDSTGFDRALVDTVRYAAAGLLLVAAVGGGAAHGVMALFGPGFGAAADAFAFLLLVPALVGLTAIQRTALLAVNRPAITSVIMVTRMVVTLGATLILTWRLGVTGAALGVVSGAAASATWMAAVTHGHLTVPLRALWPMREMAALGAGFVVGFVAARSIDAALDPLVGLVPAILAGSAAYTTTYWVLGGVNTRDRRRLAGAVARVKWLRRRPVPVAPARGSRHTAGALPNLLIIGAAKCGTTSLHRYLDQHPDISMAGATDQLTTKELRFFTDPDWRSEVDRYTQHFSAEVAVRGEATPAYTYYPLHRDVPKRIQTLVPEARLIYLVRDPIERIASHWVQRYWGGDRRSFEDWMREYDRPDNLLVCPSRYATQIEQYLRYFDPSQILILDQQELRSDRRATLRRVFAFLGVDAAVESRAFDEELNARTEKQAFTGPGYELWTRVLGSDGAVGRVGRGLPVPLRRAIGRPVKRVLSRTIDTPVIDERLRAKLTALLEDEVDRFRDLAGRDFPHWSL